MSDNVSQLRPVDEPLWTGEQVAQYLQISLSMVYKLRRTGRLPSVPIGALYRFNPEQVRAFAQGGTARKVVPIR